MAIKLKPLSQQVMVILGASSGIGRETARRAADRGAIVVVAARNAAGLATLVEEITALGGKAVAVTCDVTDEIQVRQVARDTVARFGRIDSWVNVAGVSVYAGFEDTTPEEFRRILEVNFMGYIHGAQAALPYLREQGGALIVISSVESIVSLPLHSAYSASKHAIEGAFDALRRELMADGVPVSVTSIKPATINTPFFTNSRSKLDVVPKGPPPLYDPAVVADCVLYAAEHPVRDLFAGGAGRSMAINQVMAPGLMDSMLARFGIPASKTDRPAPEGQPGNLYTADGDDRARGDFTARARPSLYTWLELHPLARTLAVGAVVTGAVLLRRRKARGHSDEPVALLPAPSGASERALANAAFADRAVAADSSYPPVRPAGPSAMRDTAGRAWTREDEASDESFPASDPPATY